MKRSPKPRDLAQMARAIVEESVSQERHPIPTRARTRTRWRWSLLSHPTGEKLCPKGRAAPELVYHKDRLTVPLRRTAPKGAADP